MKFVTSKDAMLRVLSVAQEVINNKSPISILSNVLLQADKDSNKVIVKCTNSTISAVTSIGAEVEEGGETTAFCDKLMGIVAALPQGDIDFESKDNALSISPKTKKAKFKVKCLATDKFPIISEFEKNGSFNVDAKNLKNMIRQTIFAVADDTSRYFMTGVFLTTKDDKMAMVATDGRRMSFCFNPEACPKFNDSIIPTKILSIIDKLCGYDSVIQINPAEKQFHFEGCGFELSTTLIEGQYPKWERVIPTGLDKTITVSKSDLEGAMKRNVILGDKNGRIHLTFEKGKMLVSTPESEVGSAKEEIAAVYQDDLAEIALNARYLSDVLKVIDGSDVSIDFKFDQDKKVSGAIVVRDAGKTPDYTHIIMPMNY